MKWTKNLVLFLFLLCLLCFGCTRKVNQKALVQIAIPNSTHSQNISEFLHAEPMSMQSVSVQSDDNEQPWNMQLDPTVIADVNCYLIAIGGPEADMRRNTCVTTTGQNVYVGRWAGGIPSGGLLSLEVPSGPQREILVVGFKSQNGACRSFHGDVDKSNLSEPVILGRVVTDLAAGPVSVTVPVTVNAASLKIDDCEGPDFNMQEGEGFYFGDGRAGSYTASGAADATTFGAPNQREAYARVTGIQVEPATNPDITLTVNSTANFAGPETAPSFLGDEVLIQVVGSRGQMGPAGDNNYDGCGYRAWQGRYAFGKVTSNVDSTHIKISRGTFLDNFWREAQPDGSFSTPGDVAAANASLSAPATATNFCFIQLVRVIQFDNFTVAASGTVFTPSFSYTVGGGVLAMRVQNTLALSSASAINLDGAGFIGQSYAAGDGIGGHTTSCPGTPGVTRTGGSCSGASEGSGGGGHGNTPQTPYVGPFGPSGGGGGRDVASFVPPGGGGAGEDCGDGSCFGTLNYKLFLGGAGGSNATYGVAGAPGAGIIFIMAKNVVVTSGAVISANGGSVNGASYAAGAGAGGSIFIGYSSINSRGNATFTAKGGDGFVADSSHHYGSGGGAGGRVHFMACKDGASNPQTPTNYSVVGGSGGTGYGGTENADAGKNGSVVFSDISCP